MLNNMKFSLYLTTLRIKCRELLNPYLGQLRQKLDKIDPTVTIFSNNCWAGHVYRYYDLPYNTPTIGLYFFPDDYLKFIKCPKHYLYECELFMTDYSQSKYHDILINKGGENIMCPIGHLDDIEIVFLHYRTAEEAISKWNRRKDRINWNNIVVKFSEMNDCSLENLIDFDNLLFPKHFVFTTKDYGLKSQIIFKSSSKCGQILNDTVDFRRYLTLSKYLGK